jgi:hypothetical protein
MNTIADSDASQANVSFSIKDSFAFAWRTLVTKFWFLLPVQYAIGAASAGVGSWIKPEPFHSIAGAMVPSLLMGGFLGILLSIVDGGKPGFFDVTSKPGLWWRYLIANYCAFVLWGVGLVLLVVPGVIAIIHTCFFGLCIADEGLGPFASFKRSSALSKGCRLKLLGFLSLLTILFGVGCALGTAVGFWFKSLSVIIGILFFGLVAATALIFCELAWVHCYRQLTYRLRDSSSQTP